MPKIQKTLGAAPKATKIKLVINDVPEVAGMQPVGSDSGNGVGQYYTILGGELVTVSVPHGRVRVSGMELSKSVQAEGIDYVYSDFPNAGSLEDYTRWGYGEGIEIATGKQIETHRNAENRYGSAHHIWSVVNALHLLGVKPEKPITLIVPVPPAYVNDLADVVKAAFMSGWRGAGDGVWTIRPKGAKKWAEYTIGKVIVVPEGSPGYAAYRFNLNGTTASLPDPRYPDEFRDCLAGRVKVVDIGFGTYDAYTFVQGRIVRDELATATDPLAGIQERMVKPILELVNNQTGAQHLTEASVDAWLRHWVESGWREEGAIFNVSGKTLRLHNLFLKTCWDYAEWLVSNRINDIWRLGADAILTIGGGWVYTVATIRQAYPQRLILEPSMFDHLKAIGLPQLNAYGAIVEYNARQRLANLAGKKK